MDGLPDAVLANRSRLELAIAIDALLEELEKESQQRRAVVELRFFLGLTDEPVFEEDEEPQEKKSWWKRLWE